MVVLINIGTVERSCMVPEKAILEPRSPEGNSWWEKVAGGSVVIPQRELDRALKISEKIGGSNDSK